FLPSLRDWLYFVGLNPGLAPWAELCRPLGLGFARRFVSPFRECQNSFLRIVIFVTRSLH
ncbi:MAG: hypothetical protein WA671_12775, partial [Candidatus Sulfotelmatobacter sp.]